MRILVVSPFPPHPANGGGRMRLWEEVRCLSQQHQLTLAAFYLPEEGEIAQAELERMCERVILVPLDPPEGERPAGIPREIHRYHTRRMQATLGALAQAGYDVVLFEHIYLAQYYSLFAGKVVLMEHNIESGTLRRFVELSDSTGEGLHEAGTFAAQVFEDADHECALLAAYEDAMWPRFPLRVTVSENDCAELARRCPTGRTIVIENGINTQETTLLPFARSTQLLYMGAMDYYPNVDAVFYFARQILPLIKRERPDVTLCVAGRNPSREVQLLAEPGQVEVRSFPRDMGEVARACGVTVVPMRIGGGSRIKILHAFALGLPVVSTRLGSEGLRVVDGEQLLIADSPTAFAEATLRLLDDEALARHLRACGRQFVEEQHDWGRIFARLEAELRAYAAGPPDPGSPLSQASTA